MAVDSVLRDVSRVFFALCALFLPIEHVLGEDAPPLEKLIELNAAELFGGNVEVKEGRLIIRYPGAGLFAQGFAVRSKGTGQIVSDQGAIKGVTMRNQLIKGAEKQFSFAGLKSGSAESRFQLGDDFKITFGLKIPNLAKNASLNFFFSRKGSREFIQSRFLADLYAVNKGKKRRARPTDRRYLGPAAAWFDTAAEAGVKYEIRLKDRNLTIAKFAGKEKETVVSLEDLPGDLGGRIGFSFDRVTFMVRDFVVETSIPREWAETAIADLRRGGKLKLAKESPAPKKESSKKEGPQVAKGGAETDTTKDWDKLVEVDIDKPDPEADEDL